MSVLDDLTPQHRARLVPADPPDWVAPMLATLTERRFSDPAWVFERKLDGVRCLAFRSGNQVRLLSRNRLPLNSTYPELVEALAGQVSADVVVDGEVVAFDGPRTSFSLLQKRLGISDLTRARRSPVPVFFYVFDIMYLDGFDLRPLPLRVRKAVLRRALDFTGPLRFTSHRNGAGENLYEQACRRGWEGVIAKRANARYSAGRSPEWLKFKCVMAQEMVVGGFTDPTGSRLGLGALLVGYYEGQRLRYAGKVGTGFTQAVLMDLRRRLDDLALDRSPFADPVAERRAHWVRPQLVAQVGFSEWTDDGKLRHPRFEGLRTDKDSHDVVREHPGTPAGPQA